MTKIVEHKEDEVFDIELEESILKKNENFAKANSQLFKTHDIKTIDIMGSIGSGKTSLIEAIVKKLKGPRGTEVTV